MVASWSASAGRDVLKALIQDGCAQMLAPRYARLCMADLWRRAAVFFAADDTLKLACRTDIGEGYRPYASEYTDTPHQLDLVESFAASFALSGDGTRFSNEPGRSLCESLVEVQTVLSGLAEHVVSGVTRLLGHPEPNEHLGFLNWSRMQINYGEPHRAARDSIHVPHEDGNFLSIIAATAPGLEQLDSTGGVRDLWSSDDEFVLIAGEIFTWVTAGAIATGFHRVRRDINYTKRYSAIFFGDPDPASVAHWAPWVRPGELFQRITDGWVRSGVPPVQKAFEARQEATR